MASEQYILLEMYSNEKYCTILSVVISVRVQNRSCIFPDSAIHAGSLLGIELQLCLGRFHVVGWKNRESIVLVGVFIERAAHASILSSSILHLFLHSKPDFLSGAYNGRLLL